MGVRLSPNNADGTRGDANPVEIYTYAANLLNVYDLAYLHAVEAEVGETRASSLLRNAYNGTFIVTGGLDQAKGEALLEEGTADLVGYGKLYIANPDLPERFAQGAELNEWNQPTFYGGDEKGYTDYPALQEVQPA